MRLKRHVAAVLIFLFALASPASAWLDETHQAIQMARIVNIPKTLGYKLEAQNRLMTHTEAYEMNGHSASLLKGILGFVERGDS